MLRLSRTLILSLLAACAVGAHATPSCAGLKSGRHVVLNPDEPDLGRRAKWVDIDAQTLVVTDADGSGTLLPTDEACRYTLPGGGPLVVSKRGLLLSRGAGSETWWSLGLPLRTVKLKALAGTWNFVRREAQGGMVMPYNGRMRLSRAGEVWLSMCAPDGGACSAEQAVGSLSVNAEGGFTFQASSGFSERWYALRLADGSRMIAGVGLLQDVGALTVLAPVAAASLPAVGDKWAHWELNQSGDGQLGSLFSASFKVLSSDPVSRSYQRKRLEDCRVDTWTVDAGREGMQRRPGGSYTDCGTGQARGFTPNLLLSLRESFGLSAFGWRDDSVSFFGLAVTKPR